MKLKLTRHFFRPDRTIGEMEIDGKFFCYTLEDTVREAGVKIPHETAIPAGIYKVVVSFSQRFKKRLPMLLDVPGFQGVRIHGGNTPEDTRGCILVAHYFDKQAGIIYKSASAEICKQLEVANNAEIEIVDNRETA